VGAQTQFGRDSDERGILERLGRFRTVHLARPERIAAAQRLEKRGLVRCWLGEGRDAGLVLVEVEWRKPRLIQPDGGSAA
jgi:hypothetical protein